jgi:hypothetical protein
LDERHRDHATEVLGGLLEPRLMKILQIFDIYDSA